VRDTVSSGAIDLLLRVRKHTEIPLALGFGISTPDHVKVCSAAGADGVIVGSAIVDIVGKNAGNAEKIVQNLKKYVRQMKTAL
jgi:tryptophan synthase alpha chain